MRELQGRVVQLGERVVKMQTLVKVTIHRLRCPPEPHPACHQVTRRMGEGCSRVQGRLHTKCAAHMQTGAADVQWLAQLEPKAGAASSVTFTTALYSPTAYRSPHLLGLQLLTGEGRAGGAAGAQAA